MCLLPLRIATTLVSFNGRQRLSGFRVCYAPSFCYQSITLTRSTERNRSLSIGLELTSHNERVAFDFSPSKTTETTIPNRPTVLFCCGFRSSMYGIKASTLKDYCIANNIAYCRFDYRGHGESCGNFVNLTLSDWIHDAEFILNKVLASHNKVIIVGSSMGGWIALHLAMKCPHRIAGINALAAAIDFFQDLFKSATPEQRMQWRTNEIVYLPSEYDPEDYPISWTMIQDAQENWLLMDDNTNNGIIPVQCPVRLIHGKRDLDIPWEKSLQLMEMLATDDTVLTLTKSGDHRLSQPEDLTRMLDTVSDLIACVQKEDLS